MILFCKNYEHVVAEVADLLLDHIVRKYTILLHHGAHGDAEIETEH